MARFRVSVMKLKASLPRIRMRSSAFSNLFAAVASTFSADRRKGHSVNPKGVIAPTKSRVSLVAPTYPIYVDNPHFGAKSAGSLANDPTVTSGQLFSQLRDALIHGLPEGPEKFENLGRLDLLETAKGYTYLRHYSNFIAGAAKQMTVISPYIPGLTSILVRI